LYIIGVAATQTRIPIDILPFPMDICDYFVTDKHWFMENMLSYLSNAVKYSSGGKVTIQVSVINQSGERVKDMSKIKATGFQLRLTVEDEGIGISKQCKAELFQPFQQTMRLAGGTGLGLYSLAKRIDALGGEFGVTGRDDGKPGSQFWFSIPYVPDTDFVPEPYISPVSMTRKLRCESSCDFDQHANGVSTANVKSGMTITTGTIRAIVKDDSHHESVDRSATHSLALTALVVEDSVVITKSTTRILTQAGYSVDSAENGAIGLDKMKAKVYDVVLMDLQMPIMDGLEATRRLRAFEGDIVDNDESCSRTRQFIIGVSGNGTKDVREDALNSGMTDFCSKPFSLRDLTDVQVRNKNH
jgi:CheY-like chemotaxis protein